MLHVHRARVILDADSVATSVALIHDGSDAERIKQWCLDHVRSIGPHSESPVPMRLYGSIESCDAGVMCVVEATESQMMAGDRVESHIMVQAGLIPESEDTHPDVTDMDRALVEQCMDTWMTTIKGAVTDPEFLGSLNHHFLKAGLHLARYNLFAAGTHDCGEYMSGTLEGSPRPKVLFVVRFDG